MVLILYIDAMAPIRKVKIVKKRTTSFPRFQADKFKRMNVCYPRGVGFLIFVAALEKAQGY